MQDKRSTRPKSAIRGHTDTFVSTLIGWPQGSEYKYKGTLYLDVSVAIGE